MALSKLVAVALSLASISFAADCTLDQPRKEGDPSGEQIAKAIGAQTELEGVCANNWRTGDEKKLENSFNHWGAHETNIKPVKMLTSSKASYTEFRGRTILRTYDTAMMRSRTSLSNASRMETSGVVSGA